jgi:hypothetical protein
MPISQMSRISLLIALAAGFTANAQVKFGDNATTINPGSLLELESTNKGLLFPRISLTSTTSWGLSGTAVAGMSIYNTNAAITGSSIYRALGAGMYYFDGTGWVSKNGVAAASAIEPWYNVATSTGATSNTQNIYQMGSVGVGTTAPSAKLEVVTTAIGTNAGIFRANGSGSNGLYAESTIGGGNAAYFNATGTSNGAASYAITGLGVYGQSTSSYGVYGRTLSLGVAGVIGYAGNNTTYGMLGFNNQYSLYGNGDIAISGTLAKGAGTFKIDHPQDPANKYLIHSFVESPDMMNIYNGNIVTDGNGEATAQLPDYFSVLNKECRYQLTAIGTFAQAMVAEEVNNSNQFKIKTDKPNVKISWQITGIRKDPYANAHRIKDVVEKIGAEKGKYVHPDLYKQPIEKSVFYTNSNAVEIKHKFQ